MPALYDLVPIINRYSMQANSLYYCWPLFLSSTALCRDIGGGYNIATVGGNAAITPNDQFIRCATFDGNGDYLTPSPTTITWDVSTVSFTLTAWINVTGNKTSNAVAFQQSSGATNWGLTGIVSGTMNATMGVAGSWQITATANPALSLGVWYHLTETWNATTKYVQLFVNGVYNAQANTSNTVGVPNSSFMIGCDAADTSGRSFNGKIAEVRLYKRLLSDAEIWRLYDPATRWNLYQVNNDYSWDFGGAALNLARSWAQIVG